jgi:hypothetical protein
MGAAVGVGVGVAEGLVAVVVEGLGEDDGTPTASFVLADGSTVEP